MSNRKNIKPKEGDLQGYSLEDWFIVEQSINQGYFHAINKKTYCQFNVYAGAKAISLVKNPPEHLLLYLTNFSIITALGLYDGEFDKKLANFLKDYHNDFLKSSLTKMIELSKEEDDEELQKIIDEYDLERILKLPDDELFKALAEKEIDFERIQRSIDRVKKGEEE